MLFSQTKTTGSLNEEAMFIASWKVPRLEAPSPKKQMATASVFLYLQANAAPTEIGCPAPTIPLAPRMPRSISAMCIEPPFPLQYPVAFPYSSAIIRSIFPPLAITWP